MRVGGVHRTVGRDGQVAEKVPLSILRNVPPTHHDAIGDAHLEDGAQRRIGGCVVSHRRQADGRGIHMPAVVGHTDTHDRSDALCVGGDAQIAHATIRSDLEDRSLPNAADIEVTGARIGVDPFSEDAAVGNRGDHTPAEYW